jgi:hypothetical protein
MAPARGVITVGNLGHHPSTAPASLAGFGLSGQGGCPKSTKAHLYVASGNTVAALPSGRAKRIVAAGSESASGRVMHPRPENDLSAVRAIRSVFANGALTGFAQEQIPVRASGGVSL